MFGSRRIAFIGAGNMAEAIIAGLLHSGLANSQLIASDIDSSRRDAVRMRYTIETTGNNRQAADWADVIVLAVEPQILDEVLAETFPLGASSKFIISVAAGYPLSRLAAHLHGAERMVRAMPNTPSCIRQGVTALAYADGVLSEDDERTARLMFEQIGQVVRVNEQLMDAVTGLSGSGPAYVYLMIEALADGGVMMGLSRQAAQILAAQTVAGAAQLVIDSGEHPGVLKDRVASPGGTTIAGLHVLEGGGFRAMLVSAVEAASRRSMELGSQS
ncbi:pyrroline-5-carboxylate reductase [Nitrospira sp. KM1]|uniref:pyrroline-5-carboxylate reductase n=1 Tax=Nitrospira sp. KM1 TaxID=1936990 RepID=UPI0013A72AAE|nr:pyrroline-5-carboxylate reductase [Nitrospira sp. KM1]BCA53973.1 pyrroline-5-carboxylate reductase [Nitrospira sp. KM1]